MAFTLRPDKYQQEKLDELTELLQSTTQSKAIWHAVAAYPKLYRRNQRLEQRVDELKDLLSEVRDVELLRRAALDQVRRRKDDMDGLLDRIAEVQSQRFVQFNGQLRPRSELVKVAGEWRPAPEHGPEAVALPTEPEADGPTQHVCRCT